MPSLRFEVETLTPLVIAGANKSNPDLRAEGLRGPGLKAVMRWWFRAMMGGIVGFARACADLRVLEGRVFGSTEGASPIMVRTYPLAEVTPVDAYLSMNDSRRAVRNVFHIEYARIKRQAIAAGTKFHLVISFSKNENEPLVLGSLALMSLLGGVGARTRRGFGSLEISPEEAWAQTFSMNSTGDSLGNTANSLESNLAEIHRLFFTFKPSRSSAFFNDVPVLAKGHARLWALEPQAGWTSWHAAMDDLRTNVYRPYKRSKNLASIGYARRNSRLASPLLIQIKRRALNKYYAVLLAFDSPHYFGSNWSDLDNFLKSLNGYFLKEVVLP